MVSPVTTASPSKTQAAIGQRQFTPRRFVLPRNEFKLRWRPTRFDRLIAKGLTSVRLLMKFWLTHVLLVFGLLLYAVSGALLFKTLETFNEKIFQHEAIEARIKLVEDLWIECQQSEVNGKENWTSHFKSAMWGNNEYLCMPDVWGVDEENKLSKMWTFPRTLAFCCSTFTMIGYGTVTPQTWGGQLFTIIYSCFGIPYCLFVLADLGQVLQACLKQIYIRGYKFYYFGVCCNKRITSPYMIINRYFVRRCRSCFPRTSHEPTVTNGETPDNTGSSRGSPDIYNSYGADDNLFLLTDLKESDFVVPVKVGVILFILYVILGAFLFASSEAWHFGEALYFIYVSLSTIGYGDLLPEYTDVYFVFVYIFVGLALMSLIFSLMLGYFSIIIKKAEDKFAQAWTIPEEDAGGQRPEELKPDIAYGRLLDVFVVDSSSVMHFSKKPSSSDLPKPQSSTTKTTPLTKSLDQPVILIQITDSRFLDYTLPYESRHFPSGNEAQLSSAKRDGVDGSGKTQSPHPGEPQVLHISEEGLFDYLKERLLSQMKGESPGAGSSVKVPEPMGRQQPSSSQGLQKGEKRQRGTKGNPTVIHQDNESTLPSQKSPTLQQQGTDARKTDPVSPNKSTFPPARAPDSKPAKNASSSKVGTPGITKPSRGTQTNSKESTSSTSWLPKKQKKHSETT